MWHHAPMAGTRTIQSEILRLWIDGVGAYLISLKPTFSIGGPSENGTAADWMIWSTLLQKHLDITHTSEGFAIAPLGPLQIADREVTSTIPLRHRTIIALGSSVRIEFTQPHPLSLTAVLKLVSPHRSVQTADAVVLLHDTCLIGSRKGHHITCGDESPEIRLTPTDGGIRCQADADFSVNDIPSGRESILEETAIVAGEGFRFRMECMRER
ncbi:MAG: hypothetical protein ACKVT0_20310 [Planctomycetaceae bacterium]